MTNLRFLVSILCTLQVVLGRTIFPPSRSKLLCNDGIYYIDQGTPLKRIEITPKTCPEGYRLARLENENDLYRAGYFVFGCLGPSQEVWLEWAHHLEAAGITEDIGAAPIKLIAPDAIEKGGPVMLESNMGNVRASVSIALDKSNSRIHALCQKIPVVVEKNHVDAKNLRRK